MSDRRRVLHIGTDRHLLRACAKHDVDAVAVRSAASADIGVRMPPHARVLQVDDQSSIEWVLAALTRAGLRDTRFTAVQTTDEWSLVTAGALAALLGSRGIDVDTAVRFRDKAVQKERVRRAGIPAARFAVIEDVRDPAAVDAWVFDRAVLKPVSGAAAALTSAVASRDDFVAALETLRASRSPARTFLLEEVVAGEEWLVDGVVFEGELVFYALGRYAAPCLVMLDERLPVSMRRLDPTRDAWAYERAEKVVSGALEALGLRDGVFHMELFHDAETGEVTFSECAARRGGALVHEEVLRKFGVDLGECALLTAIGERPQLTASVDPAVVGTTYLTAPHGTIIGYPSTADVARQPGVEFVRVDRPFGAVLPKTPGDTTIRLAQVLLVAETEDEWEDRADRLRAWFAERLLVAPLDVTMRELRDWHRAHWPDADFGDVLYERPS